MEKYFRLDKMFDKLTTSSDEPTTILLETSNLKHHKSKIIDIVVFGSPESKKIKCSQKTETTWFMKEVDFIYRNEKNLDFEMKDEFFQVCYKYLIYDSIQTEIKIASVPQLLDFEFLIT
jgi:hypothetical protein